MFQNQNGYSHNNNQYQSYGYGTQQTSINDYLIGTFRWMAIGLFLTFGVAMFTAFTGFFSVVSALYLPLTIAEIAMVVILSARIQKIQPSTARMLFMAYAVLNGMVMSFYFIVYDFATLLLSFLAAAVYFGLLALYGATTKRDLSSWGPKLSIALVAMIVCSFIGMFTGFSFITSLIYSGVGLVVFMLLTAYDTQKLYHYYQYYAGSPDMLEKSAIFGALSLYLDFINIFIMLVRMFGSRSRD